MKKRCSKCGAHKTLTEFRKRADVPGGLRGACRPCETARTRVWWNERGGKQRTRAQERSRYLHYKFAHAALRARKRGAPFTIREEDLKMPAKCPYLGTDMSADADEPAAWPSLDRLEPNEGYVKGNVIVCSYRANRIKNDATADELERIARGIRLALFKKRSHAWFTRGAR